MQETIKEKIDFINKYVHTTVLKKLNPIIHNILSTKSMQELMDAQSASGAALIDTCSTQSANYLKTITEVIEDASAKLINNKAHLERDKQNLKKIEKELLSYEKSLTPKSLIAKKYELKGSCENLNSLIFKENLMLKHLKIKLHKYQVLSDLEHTQRSYLSLSEKEPLDTEFIKQVCNFALHIKAVNTNARRVTICNAGINAASLISLLTSLSQEMQSSASDSSTTCELESKAKITLECISSIFSHIPKMQTQNDPLITHDPQTFNQELEAMIKETQKKLHSATKPKVANKL